MHSQFDESSRFYPYFRTKLEDMVRETNFSTIVALNVQVSFSEPKKSFSQKSFYTYYISSNFAYIKTFILWMEIIFQFICETCLLFCTKKIEFLYERETFCIQYDVKNETEFSKFVNQQLHRQVHFKLITSKSTISTIVLGGIH